MGAKKMKMKEKDFICNELKLIARMIARDYKTDPRKTTKAIYRQVSKLHNDIKDIKELENET